jgi:hypothetical protein
VRSDKVPHMTIGGPFLYQNRMKISEKPKYFPPMYY